jgi:signal peptidase II
MDLKKIKKVLIIVMLATILVDQISKILIDAVFTDSITIIPDAFSIEKIENEGIAFGLNKQNIINIFLSVFIMCLIVSYMINQQKNMDIKKIVFLGLIIGGGASNLIDRIFRGAVLDFIKIGTFPVFNLADCFITVRMGVVCYRLFIYNGN